jgi:transposase
MKRIPRRIFTEEFKREAIKLVTEQGLTMAEAGKKLDIATKSLRTWVAQLERGELKASLGASKLTADQQRIRELERELAIAKMERDILKKATVGSTSQGNILSTLVLGVGNGANGTTWTITTPEERIVAPMEGWSVAH